AWVLRRVGRHEEALAAAERSVSADPDADHLGTRCWIRMDGGDRGGALADCTRAGELNGSSRIDRGMLAYLHGGPGAARRWWSEAIEKQEAFARELEPWLSRAGGETR